MSAYPELQKLMNEHSVFEKLKIDGKLYAFPKINLNNPYNSYDPYIFVYRRDWAQKMGLDYAPMQNMTWEEFVDFLKQVQEQDPMQLGEKLVPLDFANGGQGWLRFAQQWNPALGNYCKTYFADAEYGEWYGYLRRDGKPTMPIAKGSTFKGPFHVPRSLAMADRLLEEIIEG